LLKLSINRELLWFLFSMLFLSILAVALHLLDDGGSSRFLRILEDVHAITGEPRLFSGFQQFIVSKLTLKSVIFIGSIVANLLAELSVMQLQWTDFALILLNFYVLITYNCSLQRRRCCIWKIILSLAIQSWRGLFRLDIFESNFDFGNVDKILHIRHAKRFYPVVLALYHHWVVHRLLPNAERSCWGLPLLESLHLRKWIQLKTFFDLYLFGV
jgi:hypothetical protein